jgi:outer membrane cobalamin receptor
MKKVFIVYVFLMAGIQSFAQPYTIYGTIKDTLSGESLFSTSIFIDETRLGTTSNAYGFYSVSLAPGTYNISFSYLGYTTIRKHIVLTGNIQLDIKLMPKNTELETVVISGVKSNVETYNTSKNEISVARIKTITAAGGEPDVLKSLQLMPGIQAANEGAANLYVRGGSYDQNLILLDEAPVYNPVHALGFFSTFNTDAIKDVTVMKGAFPAQYGGRLSSVVDITMREGNYNKTQVSAGIGLIASHLTIEGPILKGKASYLVSGRYSYAGQMLNFMGGTVGRDILHHYKMNNFNDKNKIWFYDLNAKVNYQINDKNHVYLSYYSGHDSFNCYSLNNRNVLDWGNFTSTLRWNHVFTNKLFSNFTFYNSRYNYSSAISEDIRNYKWKSDIQETGLKADFTYYLNQNNNIKSGVAAIYHRFSPGTIYPNDTTSIIIPFSLDEKRSFEISGYLSNDQVISPKLSVNYGLRYNLFLNMGPGTVYKYNEDMTSVTDSAVYGKNEIINSYGGLEPRFSVRYKLGEQTAVKLAYAYTKQYLHLLSNSTVGLPTDTWLPPDSYIKPQSSQQLVLGFYQTLYQNNLELSIETYYKTLQNIVDYKDNADLFLNKHIETQLLHGKGYSYGLETMLEKKKGKLSGWIAYTLAKTQYQIDGVNNNSYYSPRYDIRNNITVTGNYRLNKAWMFSTTFKYASGGFVTVPDQMFIIDGASFYTYSSRNNYKLPAYHRLDFSVYFNPRKNEHRHMKSEWVLSVVNVYSRRNIYSLTIQTSQTYELSGAYKMYLYGILPTISYNIKF